MRRGKTITTEVDIDIDELDLGEYIEEFLEDNINYIENYITEDVVFQWLKNRKREGGTWEYVTKPKLKALLEES